MQDKYVPPVYDKTSFSCPFCGAHAGMDWSLLIDKYNRSWSIDYARCAACTKMSIWYNKKLIYPSICTAPPAHAEMPECIKSDFEEARNIVNASPRGACALLRLAIDKLCDELLKNEDKSLNLNQKIKKLLDLGLPNNIIKLLDIVRISGNDAVHDLGILNVEDNPKIANILFHIINTIVERVISEQRKLDELYSSLPESKKMIKSPVPVSKEL